MAFILIYTTLPVYAAGSERVYYSIKIKESLVDGYELTVDIRYHHMR